MAIKIETARTHFLSDVFTPVANVGSVILPTELEVLTPVSEAAISTMAERAPSEVKDTLKRIEEHPNVVGVIIMDRDGQPVHSTLDAMETAYYIRQCSSLTAIARGTIRETDPTDDLQFFRIRTKKFEIMLAPERDYLLIVLQNTTKMPGKFV
ncbi:unnamed protein product [Porites lobata]|uniref:Roadblock/LAMTOR2 domain-containing protein n=1 Tax=Porites lobata TaxID=104759 RepID=A0ABN8NR72_9CNID|nr:unnamed protein product [Porites lobata]